MTVSLVGRMAMGRSISLWPDLVTHATCTAPVLCFSAHWAECLALRDCVAHALSFSNSRLLSYNKDV